MKRVELYLKVRRAVMIDGMSRRSAARFYGIDRKTVDKMLVSANFYAPRQRPRGGSGEMSGSPELVPSASQSGAAEISVYLCSGRQLRCRETVPDDVLARLVRVLDAV